MFASSLAEQSSVSDSSIRLSSASPSSSHTRSRQGSTQRITSSSDVNVSIIQRGRIPGRRVEKP